MAKERVNRRTGWVLAVSIWTFGLAIGLGLVSQLLLTRIGSILISFLILILVVILGVIFDLVGTAVTAARQSPLNAKAARKVPGAKEAVNLVQNADRVANFCNDVVGDISGIVSGALAALLIVKVYLRWSERLMPQTEIYFNIILTASVAALTVGGKALGKSIAINRSTEVILIVGRLITRLKKLPGLFQFYR